MRDEIKEVKEQSEELKTVITQLTTLLQNKANPNQNIKAY